MAAKKCDCGKPLTSTGQYLWECPNGHVTDETWRMRKLTKDNWREILSEESSECIREAMHDPSMVGCGKIGIGVKRGLNEFTLEGGGDTNNFFVTLASKSTEELQIEVERLKKQLEAAKRNVGITIDAESFVGGGAGVGAAADRGGDRKVTALLAAESHQDI